jgi:hypothetical protein
MAKTRSQNWKVFFTQLKPCLLSIQANQESVKRAIEKLRSEMKQAKEPKSKAYNLAPEITSKREAEVFKMGSLYGTLLGVNAVFSVAAVYPLP